jgi:RecA/RadA recombinase
MAQQRRKRRGESTVSSVVEDHSKRKVSKTAPPWSKMMTDIRKEAEGRKVDLYSPDMFDAEYGVKYFLDTGLPSMNLYLGQDGINTETDDPVYGIASGRVIEFVGNEQSFKTFLMHQLGAEVLVRGGVFFYISSEIDFDLSFFRGFYERRGLSWDYVQDHVIVSSAQTVLDLQERVKIITPKMSKFHEENENPGPAIVCVDSLGAMMGGENLRRQLDPKTDNDKTGSHASELHDFFKMILRDFARLDVTLAYTNHYRANMDLMSRSKQKPAHDAITKYYATVRVDLRAGKVLKKVTRQGQEHIVSRELNVRVRKVRGSLIGDGSFSLVVYQNGTFDYVSSLIDALMICRIVSLEKKALVLDLDPESEDPLEASLADRFEEKTFISPLLLKKYLKEDLEGCVLLEKLAYKKGPWLLNENEEQD